MSKDVLLVIGAGKHQASLIQTAGRLGFYTLAVDINPDAEGFIYSNDKIIQSAYDYEAILEILYEKYEVSSIKGVITQAARGCILTVAKISERLGLRHLNTGTAEVVISKEKTTKLFNSDSVIGIYSNIDEITPDITFPCIVKYENMSGGLGVFKINSLNELYKLKDKTRSSSAIIVEKFVAGRNVGVVGIKNGNDVKIYGIIEKHLNPDLTLDYSVFPAHISDSMKSQLVNYTLHVLDKLGFDFGPFQLEVILNENGRPFFVELEPSVLGSYISEVMIPETSLNNMIVDSVELVCSGRFEKKTFLDRYVCLQKYYYSKKCGQVKEFRIINGNRNVLFKPYLNSGEYIADKRLYVANSLVISKSIKEAKKHINGFELTIGVDNEVN